jgi:SulP family sulfate permease
MRNPQAAHLPVNSPSCHGPLDWETLKRDFARQDLLPSLPSALLCWFLSVIFSVSLAALIFRGPLEPYLAWGIGMSLSTAVAVGLVTTLSSSIRGCIAIPSDRTAPMLAILTGSIAASFPAGAATNMIATCLAALTLATALNGVILWLLGHFRMGLLVRFLPFPVVGGFMAGAGWLLVKGALTVATGFELDISNLPRLFEPTVILRWGPALAMALILLITSRRVRHLLVIPSIALVGVVLFYGIALFTRMGLPELRAIGWLPAPFPHSIAWHPLSLSFLSAMNGPIIAAHLVTFATIVLVSAISLLMISSSLEVSANVEVDADRELQSAGLANLASLVAGGFVGFHSLSLTSLALRVGPNSRWVGLFTALATALTLFFAPSLASYLPVPLLSGLLLYLGLNFMTEWLIDSYRRMRRSDYLIIVLILIVVAWAGYIIGVGVGLIMAVVLFALRYSLIDVVRLEINGAQHRSNVDRTPEEIALLRPVRPSIHILKLQGFIFFGTAHSLLHRVRLRAGSQDQTQLRYLILDFRHVTGVDSSALLSLSKLLSLAQQSGFATLCSSVPVSLLTILKRDPSVCEGFAFHSDIDHAVEWCEGQMLAGSPTKSSQTPMNFHDLLKAALHNQTAIADRLVHYFVPQTIAAGEILARQGEKTRDLFLIQEGRISALFLAQNGETIRLRTLGAGSVVGEIGMYSGRPRSASLVAEVESKVWRLCAEALVAMEQNDPRVAVALHDFLARILANRLAQANELLEISLR